MSGIMSTARTLIVLSQRNTNKVVSCNVFEILTDSTILYSIIILLLKPYFSV